MDPRFVTRSMHAYLDYPVALILMAAPKLLGLGASHPAAYWLATGAGMAAFVLTLLTDHHLGVLRVLPYWSHLLVDLLVGLTFLAAPTALGFSPQDSWFYWANGAAVLLVVGLHKPEPAPPEAAAAEAPQTALTSKL